MLKTGRQRVMSESCNVVLTVYKLEPNGSSEPAASRKPLVLAFVWFAVNPAMF